MSILNNQVTIVTGAASGIGRAAAILFAKNGSNLTIVDINAIGLEETYNLIKQESNVEVLKLAGDVTDEVFSKSIVDETIKKFTKLNILLNVAGVVRISGLQNMNMQDYDLVLNVNLRSIILLTKNCLDHLIAQKGSIVNVSSVLGNYPGAKVMAYSIAKSGLNQFMRCLAVELAPKNVRVNNVCPGTIKTGLLLSTGLYNETQVEKYYEKGVDKEPFGRYGIGEDVAKAMLFLASDQSSFITGEFLTIDGGRSLVNY